VIFNFHGYPWLIHKLVYRRSNQERIHVRGYKEEGNINTPLELAILNQIDRFNLVIDVIDRVPKLGSAAAHVKERMKNQHHQVPHLLPQARHRSRGNHHWQWPY
jgi:xylulose-5-phosphate/fructose-6-phosphate phosphoketolase